MYGKATMMKCNYELVIFCRYTGTAVLELCTYLTDLHEKLTLTTVMTVFSFSFLVFSKFQHAPFCYKLTITNQ